jgi:SAM-dependent methyltransferase
MCPTATTGTALQKQRPTGKRLTGSGLGGPRSETTSRLEWRRWHRARVLELGSGPGLLAHRVLQRCPDLDTYTLLDFSEPMRALSRERLAPFPAASFVLASFKSDDWTRRVEGCFDCVLSMQAIHELRHKRHAERVYKQAHEILAAGGLIMICDHTPFDDSSTSTALYMTEAEQQQALAAAGSANVHVELSIDSLVVYAGDRLPNEGCS